MAKPRRVALLYNVGLGRVQGRYHGVWHTLSASVLTPDGSSSTPIVLTGEGGDGEPGPMGPPGPPGAAGSAGSTGATGPAGPPGTPGSDGDEGPAGPPGPQGSPGASGTNGATGPQGAPGADGLDGADGADGPPGPQGLMGPQGPQGAPGVDGEDGEGFMGPPGQVGPTGATGPAGPATPYPLILTAEVSIGATSKRGGKVYLEPVGGIPASRISKPCIVQQRPLVRGKSMDECEHTIVAACGEVVSTKQILVYWTSNQPVHGRLAFNILIGS